MGTKKSAPAYGFIMHKNRKDLNLGTAQDSVSFAFKSIATFLVFHWI
jgi:hypothetical protein